MKTCIVCNKKSSKVCSRCKTEKYCGKECQIRHWREHKLSCIEYAPDDLEEDPLKPGNLMPIMPDPIMAISVMAMPTSRSLIYEPAPMPVAAVPIAYTGMYEFVTPIVMESLVMAPLAMTNLPSMATALVPAEDLFVGTTDSLSAPAAHMPAASMPAASMPAAYVPTELQTRYEPTMNVDTIYSRPDHFPPELLEYLRRQGFIICSDNINFERYKRLRAGGRSVRTYQCMKCGICHVEQENPRYEYQQFDVYKLTILHRFEYKKALCAIARKLRKDLNVDELAMVERYIDELVVIEKAITNKEAPTIQEIFEYYLFNNSLP